MVRADALRDAAGLARGNLGLVNVIQQRCFTVIDVTHDGNYGCSRYQVVEVVFAQELRHLLCRRRDALFSLVYPFHFHILSHGNHSFLIEQLAHLNRDTLHEKRFDNLRLRRGEKFGEIFDRHAIHGNFENLHSHGSVFLERLFALRALCRFASSSLFHLIATTRTTHIHLWSTAASRFATVLESKVLSSTAAAATRATAAARLGRVSKVSLTPIAAAACTTARTAPESTSSTFASTTASTAATAATAAAAATAALRALAVKLPVRPSHELRARLFIVVLPRRLRVRHRARHHRSVVSPFAARRSLARARVRRRRREPKPSVEASVRGRRARASPRPGAARDRRARARRRHRRPRARAHRRRAARARRRVRKHRRRGRRHCAGGTIDAPGGTIDDRRDRRTSIDDRSIDAIARSTDDRSRDRRSADRRSADRAIRRSGDSRPETGRDGRTGDGWTATPRRRRDGRGCGTRQREGMI